MKTAFAFFLLLICSISMFAQDFALAQLENSPRHHEWVDVEYGERKVATFVAYPERSDKAPVVIVIHENRGLNDWARSFADQLAEKGYLAVAPDLISYTNPDYEKTTDYPSSDEARKSIYALTPELTQADLEAVADYAKSIPSGNGTIAIVGFCWGGSQTFRMATYFPDAKSFNVFYGTAPKEGEGFENISAPVFGYYGGADARVNATIEATEAEMKEADKTYEYIIYPDAGHAFMRRGDDPNEVGPNKTARDEAWKRLLEKLGK